MLKIENIAKIFENPLTKEKNLVLRGIDLELKDRELVFLVGKSGSGKSSLLRIIAGIEKPTVGKIIFNNIQIHNLSRKERYFFWQKNLGFIFQEPTKNLFTNLNVESNIKFPMKILNHLNREQQNKRVRELLEFVDQKENLKRKISSLSGGEQQRIAICVGIANDPSIILADEPTGELDSINSNKIIDLFHKILDNSETQCIVVTHNYSLIRKNPVFLLENGLLRKIIN